MSTSDTFRARRKSKLSVGINGASAAIDSDIKTTEGAIADVAVESADEAYISFVDKPTIQKIKIATGEVLQTIRIEVPTSLKSGARKLLILDSRLFASISVGNFTTRASNPVTGYLAVIDRVQGAVEKLIELKSTPPQTNREVLCQAPDLPLVQDQIRNHLIIACKGDRGANKTGSTVRVNLSNFELTNDPLEIPSTFNGHRLHSKRFMRQYELQHTSTPTSSTHVIPYSMDASGARKGLGRALFDLFDESDEVSMNADETLGMMANACLSGFCFKGKGITFFKIEDGQLLPKLKSDLIGFDPVYSVFLVH